MKMKRASIFALLVWALLWSLPMLGQTNTGELRLTVTDESGSGVKSTVMLVSEANQYNQTLVTDDAGVLDVERLPYGPYQLTVTSKGFAEQAQAVEINSALPVSLTVKLSLSSVKTEVTVSSEVATLINPDKTNSAQEIGREKIEDRVASLPGRSMQELVNDEPGWLFEGNDVLHPRGSEYQTQIVINGIPLTDDRSPGFSPDLPVEDVEEAKVYTAGYPAQYGRKLSGVIALDTLGAHEPGLHGHAELYGGSYGTENAYSELQYTWKGNTLGVNGYGARSDHYLNPVVPQNYHNSGTTGGWGGNFERDLTPKDRITLTAQHGFSRFQNPNEVVQQIGGSIPTVNNPGVPCAPNETDANCVQVAGGQVQDGSNFETMGTVVYQHIFSDNAVGWLRGMVRNKQRDFNSNALSWPIADQQHNYFNEGYFNGSLALHRNRHDLQFGFESDNKILHENFSYDFSKYCPNGPNDSTTPDCPNNPNTVALFNPGTPLSFAFLGSHWDLSQAAWAADTMHLGKWTIDAGLRWDHYQLIVNQNAVSPRVAASRYLPKLGVLLHASYDRVFETPNFDNILISSFATGAIVTGSPIPVKPSHGNFYEAGITKGFNQHLRLDVNYFLRRENNVADDDTLLGTIVAFPVSWDRDVVYGAEAKITVPQLWHFSGWVSYAYQVATVFAPVTGGLLLENSGDLPTSGHFPATQDQRNTLRSRIRYQMIPRLWVAFGADYNSGLPFQPNLTQAQSAAIYGQNVVDQLNFDRGRILPEWMENASVGADLYHNKGREVHLQFDVANLSNRLNVLDFGGLFSQNAIGPDRSYYARLSTTF
jgi:hypothetical protein